MRVSLYSPNNKVTKLTITISLHAKIIVQNTTKQLHLFSLPENNALAPVHKVTKTLFGPYIS